MSLIALMCASKLGAPNLSLEVVGWRCLPCPMHCNRRKWATCTPASRKLGFRIKGLPSGVALFLIILLHLGFDHDMEHSNQTATEQIEPDKVDVWSIRQQLTTQGQRMKKTLNKSKLKKYMNECYQDIMCMHTHAWSIRQQSTTQGKRTKNAYY